MSRDRRRSFKPTKLLLYVRVSEIIAELRVPECSDMAGRRQGHATLDECSGAQDILYRLMSTASVHAIARVLKRDPQRVYDAIDIALSMSPSELTAIAKRNKR